MSECVIVYQTSYCGWDGVCAYNSISNCVSIKFIDVQVVYSVCFLCCSVCVFISVEMWEETSQAIPQPLVKKVAFFPFFNITLFTEQCVEDNA